MNKKISIPFFTLIGLITSISYNANTNQINFINTAEAKCLIPCIYRTSASPAAANCPVNKDIETFSGGALGYINQFKTDIIASGEAVRRSMQANASSEIDVFTAGNKEILETMSKLTNTELKDTLNLERTLLDARMHYTSELAERELRARTAKVALDDTAEEILFINHKLNMAASSGNVIHVQNIINEMKQNFDNDPSFVIPIRIKSAESILGSETGETCPEYDPAIHTSWSAAQGQCFFAHKANPGSKLERYFEECSRIKRETILATKKDSIRSSVAKTLRSSQGRAVQVVNSEAAIAQRVSQQRQVSCNPKEFDFELCKTTNKEEYLTKVINNEIIPFGEISAANFFTPSDVGSIDGLTNASSEEITAFKLTNNLDSGNQVLSDNTAPIINTYRTSNQYLAAKDFVDNIVNKEIVANQNIYSRTTTNNLLFQSKFLSRAASLSVAENSLNKPIENRIGKNLAEALANNTELDPNSMIKEDINGAGILDELIHSINQDYKKIVIGAGDSNKLENLYDMSRESSEEWQLMALIKQNELALEKFLQNERIEILLATMLANMVNSKQNIEYLELLRNR